MIRNTHHDASVRSAPVKITMPNEDGGPEASPSQTLLPADKQDEAMMAVLKQADVLSAGWMV